MRWKLHHRDHDPRQLDLLAALALFILIAAAWRFFTDTPNQPSTTPFIVPSQTVHW
jgi:hypothetical protein